MNRLYKRVKGHNVREYIEKRTLDMAKFVVENKSTVRGAAQYFGVSKSTAHQDLSIRICMINPQVAAKVRKILDQNKAERHIRGGMATKTKYENKHKNTGK